MLKEIRDFLETHGPCETATLALHLKTDRSATQGMLEFLEQRGQVNRIEVSCGSSGCGDCGGCGNKKKGRVEREANDVIFWSAGPKKALHTGEAKR